MSRYDKQTGTFAAGTQTLAELEDAETKYAAQEAAIAQARKDSAFVMVGALFSAFPKLMKIKVSGYTPGFNDGDPCTHGQNDAAVNGRGEYDNDEDAESMEELPEDDAYRVRSVISGLSTAFELIFDTNWEVTFTRQPDGSINWHREYYDCGY